MKWLIGVSVFGLCLCVGCSRKVTEHLTVNTDTVKVGTIFTTDRSVVVETESLFVAPVLLDSGGIIAFPPNPPATSFHYGLGLRPSITRPPVLVPVMVKKKTVSVDSKKDSVWNDTTVVHQKVDSSTRTKKQFDWATLLAGMLLMVAIIVILKYLFFDSSTKKD